MLLKSPTTTLGLCPCQQVQTGMEQRRNGKVRDLLFLTSLLQLMASLPVVLPHEKLYLEHLPSADRYYKSFMHRDVINFVVMTKCAIPLSAACYKKLTLARSGPNS